MQLQSIEQKFFRYVDKSSNGCWRWFGKSHTISHTRRHKYSVLHIAYSFVNNGVLPAPGTAIQRTCGNSCCVNPQHLIPSTMAGSLHPRAKLTEANVLSILRARRGGAKLKDLSVKYGVSTSVISQIINRNAWTTTVSASVVV